MTSEDWTEGGARLSELGREGSGTTGNLLGQGRQSTTGSSYLGKEGKWGSTGNFLGKEGGARPAVVT
jgi:hypothetical protein